MKSKLTIVCLMVLLATAVYAAGSDNTQVQQTPATAPAPQVQKLSQVNPVVPPPAPAPVQKQFRGNPTNPPAQSQGQGQPRVEDTHRRGGEHRYRGNWSGYWGGRRHIDRWHWGWGFRRPLLFFDFWDSPTVEVPYYVPVPYPQAVVPPPVVPAPSANAPENNPGVFVSFSGGDLVGGAFVGSIKSHVLASGDMALVNSTQDAILEIDVVTKEQDSNQPGAASNATISYGWLPGRQLVTTQTSVVLPAQVDNMAASVVAYVDQLVHQGH